VRKIISKVNYKQKAFYIISEGKMIGFYLSNRLAKTFLHHLREGILVDFVYSNHKKRYHNRYLFQVLYFQQIISLDPYYIHFDLEQLRLDMRNVLNQHDYFLFLDFEMTMPGYRQKGFRTEIIQVGYVLSKAKGPIIIEDGYYVLPLDLRSMTRRTYKFLSINEELFLNEAKPYSHFYQALAQIIDQYHPKLVVWGKNDATILEDSYQLQQIPSLTTEKDFIDLLKLHKDYYNLKDDLGLFKAYKAYYDVEHKQAHHAKDDALVTKYVFDGFIDLM
jgi:sporulation inhibitor KapD